jgi:hypothetical protein
LAISVVLLVRAWVLQPETRIRVFGLACVMGAMASLALGTGWGRSGLGDQAGLQSRYITLAAPVLAVAYVTFASYGPLTTRKFLPMILFTGACLLLWPNNQEAMISGRNSKQQSVAFDRDVIAGTPLFRLVRRHTPFLHPSQEALHKSLLMLQHAGTGKFRSLGADPIFREQNVPLAPAEIRLARWHDGVVEVTGPDPWIRFDLPAPVKALGVRIRYSHSSTDGGPAHFRLAWRSPGQFDFPAEQQYGNWTLATGQNLSTTVWIDATVSQFRLQPDNRPCDYTISELTLLLQDGATNRAAPGGS